MYDYGSPELNMRQYGQVGGVLMLWSHAFDQLSCIQLTPPMYNVSQLMVPTVLFTGGNDWLSNAQDIKGLVPKIQHVVQSQKRIDPFQHLDFIWGMSAAEHVYQVIIGDIRAEQVEWH